MPARAALAVAVASVLVLAAGPARPSGAAPAARPQGTIVFAGSRSGSFGIFAVRADGSGLGQLTRSPAQDVVPVFSPDGRRILFTRGESGLWVMSADGSGRRRLAPATYDRVWSPDSRRVVYAVESTVAIVSVDARRRLVVPGRNEEPAWSPDGKRLAVLRIVGDDRIDLAVVGADGRGLATIRRDVGYAPLTWLPSGLISFGGRDGGVLLVRPDGRNARRLRPAPSSSAVAWAPDGRRFAFTNGAYLPHLLVATAGGRARDVTPRGTAGLSEPAWSPDGRWLAVRSTPPRTANQRRQTDRGDVLVVAADGSSWRRVTPRSTYPYGYDNGSPSWRPRSASPGRLGGLTKPWPAETASPTLLEASGPVMALAADGARVAMAVGWSPHDCGHVSVWRPGTRPVHIGLQELCGGQNLGTLPALDGRVTLAGTRVAWTESGASPSTETVELMSTTAARPATAREVDIAMHCPEECVGDQGGFLGDLYGDGSLIVYDTWNECSPTDPIHGAPDCEPNGEPWHGTTVKKQQLRRIVGSRNVAVRSDAGSFQATSVDAGRISVLEPGGAVDVVRAADGSIVHRLALAPGEALAARLSGSQLLVLTATGLEAYDAGTGARAGAVRLPPSRARRLADFDRGVAVYVEGRTVHVVRLADGRRLALTPPGKGRVLAQLEPEGLFVGSTRRRGTRPGRVTFTTRAEVARRLG